MKQFSINIKILLYNCGGREGKGREGKIREEELGRGNIKRGIFQNLFILKKEMRYSQPYTSPCLLPLSIFMETTHNL